MKSVSCAGLLFALCSFAFINTQNALECAGVPCVTDICRTAKCSAFGQCEYTTVAKNLNRTCPFWRSKGGQVVTGVCRVANTNTYSQCTDLCANSRCNTPDSCSLGGCNPLTGLCDYQVNFERLGQPCRTGFGSGTGVCAIIGTKPQIALCTDKCSGATCAAPDFCIKSSTCRTFDGACVYVYQNNDQFCKPAGADRGQASRCDPATESPCGSCQNSLCI